MPNAKCERTGKTIPISEGFFVATPSTGEWSFICADAPEELGDYPVKVEEFCKTSSTIFEWIEDLERLTWFKAEKLYDFCDRFRFDIEYGGLQDSDPPSEFGGVQLLLFIQSHCA